jgi:hypothetical protein
MIAKGAKLEYAGSIIDRNIKPNPISLAVNLFPIFVDGQALL